MITRRTALRALIAMPVLAHGAPRAEASTQLTDDWTPLFNGRDFAGWETFLGKPDPTVDLAGLARNAKGEYTETLGINRDPKGVFSVVPVDGGMAIRISGEVYGALTTVADYDSYHLRFDVKWGERIWPPRAGMPRDSGCCYHAVPPHGASYGFWMRSCEFQVMPGGCGDFYSLAGVIADVAGDPVTPGDPKTEVQYRKGATRIVGHTRRIIRAAAVERPDGEWNTLELYCLGQTSHHVVNGTTVMVLTGLRQPVDGREVPLTAGRLQLQSEGTEVFYRNVAIRRIGALPSV